jgi:hypothetical protein
MRWASAIEFAVDSGQQQCFRTFRRTGPTTFKNGHRATTKQMHPSGTAAGVDAPAKKSDRENFSRVAFQIDIRKDASAP